MGGGLGRKDGGNWRKNVSLKINNSILTVSESPLIHNTG